MKKLRIILRSLTILVLISSCNKDQISMTEDVESPFSQVVSLTSNNKINDIVRSNYGPKSNGRVTSDFGELLFDDGEIGYTENSSTIATMIPFSDGISALTVISTENGDIYEEYIATITPASETSSDVKYYTASGNIMLTFSVVDGIIENIANPSNSGRTEDWNSCATCAVKSCSQDGGCAILCGIFSISCLGAITVACIGSNLAC